ncbi:organelle RRM domain-containing protein 1, chloroplastic isoform X1 [Lactuca sativa]|uniref:RRM domain-containing protein n=1 Tax=Lactuca sativa TaxID=4236 RepID=A0A9R1UMA8_LACSA|nr:organelle RRM domain-containing protein 1, chloroplastic isoform X1 [Lactuca sativa]KAJ0189543.1 hypothetical protein LSAT_V11C800398310 [Lactuca sativa]
MASSMAPALSSSLCSTPQKSSIIPFLPSFQTSISLQFNFKFRKPISKFKQKNTITLTAITCLKSGSKYAAEETNSSFAVTAPSLAESNGQRNWIVVVKAPPSQQAVSKPDVIDYYVKILERVLGSEKEAQGCIYNAFCDNHFSFCCDMDEETSQKLACLPEVLSIKPDPDFNSVQKGYSNEKTESNSFNKIFSPLFPSQSLKHWLVRVEMPASGVLTRAHLVDYYTQILTKVLGNEKDAQMCIYHISLHFDYGFCCELNDEYAKELSSVPGVISVRPDESFDSDDKDYRDYNIQDSSLTNQPTNIKTKKLFVTGLSFYTSEKTLRAAFEGFGELVEVKIIMDKISKRSKGFAFIEYTTEEAASAALKEMNGKIINGWMIVVDVAKTNPPKYSRGRPRPPQ